MVYAVLTDERRDIRDGNIGRRFGLDLLGVDDDCGMENLLRDGLVEIVGHRPDEHTLREVGDLGCRDQIVKLRIGRGRHVVVRAGYRFPLLDDLPETLRQRAGRVAHDLPREDIADRVDDHLRLFLPVVTLQLREVLKTQTHGDLVRAGRSYQVIQPPDIDRRELVDNKRRFQFAFLIDKAYES